ncbi:putative candidate secreted effector protein [Blumeria hordei DH14]|uniref:Putative candidate secreted effector protein n=1 Tax=Blumeria graminis f. sp. hordei (strain DH14) TaxID=546991 RepID=N1JPL5_BLUG1|nr:putative candidate secreted effector protein [Blumeria hordei DH14]
MKGLSPLYLVLTSLLVYTISANVVESDFICEKDVVPKERINTAISNACSTLRNPSSLAKFPAVFDASTVYFIHDAILFSWPVKIVGENYYKGHAGNFRLLIDSSCNFHGIIVTTKNRPVLRCYQPVKAVRLHDLSLSFGPSHPTVFRGYRCQNKVFELSFVYNTLKTSLHLYKRQISNNINFHLYGHPAVDELFHTRAHLLPSEVINFDNHYIEKSNNPYFFVINYNFERLGMVSKYLNSWTKCDELYENEPELRQSSDKNKNSIGEFIYPIESDYICGTTKFSRNSINSHMQLACNLIGPQDESTLNNLKSIFGHPFILHDVGFNSVFKQTLKFSESEVNVIANIKPIRAFVVFDKNCNFHGVFWLTQRNLIRCLKST